jgi:hypothetical protein
VVRLTVHGTGSGVCLLTGKECDGLAVTFEDGTVRQGFLSWKSFRQLCAMKCPPTVSNGVPVAVPAG